MHQNRKFVKVRFLGLTMNKRDVEEVLDMRSPERGPHVVIKRRMSREAAALGVTKEEKLYSRETQIGYYCQKQRKGSAFRRVKRNEPQESRGLTMRNGAQHR